MIGKELSSGNHFQKCLAYNAREKNQDGQAKCAWEEYRNLPAFDPNSAALRMERTAEKKYRSDAKDPLYHYAINWHPKDNPTKREQLEVADRWLEYMGLEDHQVQITSHVDKPYSHIHLAINRVHPLQHRSWDKWKYKERSETILKDLEKEYGWEVVPGKHHPEYGKEFVDNGKGPEAWEFHYQDRMKEIAEGLGLDLGDIDGRTVKEKAKEIQGKLFSANSFRELDQALDKQGLWLEQKGQGMVFTDGRLHVKASDISRGLSGPKREEAYQESLEEYIKWREGELDLQASIQVSANWKEALDREELKGLEEIYVSRLPKMEKRAKQMEEMNRSYKQQMKGITDRLNKAIDNAYLDPQKAGGRFQSFWSDIDPSKKFSNAEKQIYDDPTKFGAIKDEAEVMTVASVLRDAQKVQGEYSNHFLKMEQDERDKAVKDAHKEVDLTRNGLGRIKNYLSEMTREGIEESEAGRALTQSSNNSLNIYRSLRVLNGVFSDDRLASVRNTELDQSMLTSLKGINETFGRVYEDPEEAKAFFSEIAWNDYEDTENGIDHIAELSENPGKFGSLKDKDEVQVLVERLRDPEKIRKAHREFLDGLGEETSDRNKISYFQKLPLQYANNEKMVGGLKSAGELNRWIGRAAQSTPAGRAIFKMSSLAIRSLTKLSGLMKGVSNARSASIQSLIKDSIGASQVRQLAQQKTKDREIERNAPER